MNDENENLEVDDVANSSDAGAAVKNEQNTSSPDVNNPNLNAGERKELTDYQNFVKSITPLLTKLDSNPELVQAILNDKVDQKLATALLSGKVKVEEAQQVLDAQKQVEKEVGTKNFSKMSQQEIEKLVFEKASEIASQTVDKKLQDVDEQRAFEENVQTFIDNTADFPEYASRINDWLAEHTDQDDIEVAYHAVKGMVLSEAAKKETAKAGAEAAKAIAANISSPNAASAGKVSQEVDPWEQLVAPRSNPNVL